MLTSYLKKLVCASVSIGARSLQTTAAVNGGAAGPHNALLTHVDGMTICNVLP